MTTTPDIEWVRIEREFDAPIQTVWAMWTEARHFESWYGPNGMSVSVSTMDAQPGGQRFFAMGMQTPQRSMTMYFKGEYKEVSAPHRLVYTESLCDEAGNVLSPASMGMPADHPEVTEVVVELREADGRTVMTMTHIGVPATSGGAGGWTQAIDKLEARLITAD